MQFSFQMRIEVEPWYWSRVGVVGLNLRHSLQPMAFVESHGLRYAKRLKIIVKWYPFNGEMGKVFGSTYILCAKDPYHIHGIVHLDYGHASDMEMRELNDDWSRAIT